MSEVHTKDEIVTISNKNELSQYIGTGKTLLYQGYFFPPGSIDKEGKPRRTREFAEANGQPLTKMPDKRYRITHPDFKYALTPLNNAAFDEKAEQSAYVELMLVGLNDLSMDEKDGSILVRGNPESDVQLLVDTDNGHIASLDLPLADSLFSIIWYNIKPVLDSLAPDRSEYEWKKVLKNCSDIGATVYGYYINLFGFGQRVYVPDFLEYIGLDPKMVKPSQVMALMSRMAEFNKLRGTIKTMIVNNTLVEKRIFMFFDYDPNTNCFYIQSPFMNRVIERAIRCKRYPFQVKGRVQYDTHGEVLYIPPVSTIVHPYLDNLPSVKSSQLADAIAVLIEICPPDGVPNITARNLIKRCSKFDYAYEMSKNRDTRGGLLRRTFTIAYEYLRDYTCLYEKYKNLQMPPIPTTKDVERNVVLKFKHDGMYRKDVLEKKVAAKNLEIKQRLNRKKKCTVEPECANIMIHVTDIPKRRSKHPETVLETV